MKHRILQLLSDNRTVGARRCEVVRNSDEESTIYLYDAIVSDAATAEWFGGVAAQTLVPEIAGTTAKTLHMRINSPGGDVFAAQAIAQAMRETDARVVAHVDGLAASAASVIMSAADEVEIAPGGFVMIHQAWTIAMGNATDMLEVAAMLEKVDASIADGYKRKAGGDKEKWAQYMQAETWFSAEEALAEKLVDRIAETTKANASAWNLAAYDRAPKIAAPEDTDKAQQLLSEALRAARMSALITRGL